MWVDFPKCCQFSLQQEGGFCDVAGDPGGATNHGITMECLSAVIGRPATVTDVKAITTSQAEAIYEPHYWQTVNGNNLPAGIDLLVFDFGINAGPQRSAMRLQGVLRLRQDGQIGPLTLAALKDKNITGLIQQLSYSHKVYYESLNGFAEFGRGWIARVARCQQFALDMVPS